MYRKVAAARGSVEAGSGRSNDDVEADFATRRAKTPGDSSTPCMPQIAKAPETLGISGA